MDKSTVKTLKALRICAITAAVIESPFVVPMGCKEIDAGQRGVKTTWGKVTGEPLTEGSYDGLL